MTISNQKSKNIKSSIIQKIGFIYFMTERDFFGYPCGPYVKIGLVKGNDDGRSSFERRKEHQTGNPREIIVEAEVKTYAQVSTLESLVHQRLAKYRIHGEWFNYGGDGIQPYVDLTKTINEDLEGQIEDNLLINQYALIEDNGEDLKPSSEAKDIHNELLKAKKEIIKIKNEKDLAKLKLRSFDKRFYRDIEGICFYEKIKPQEKFDKVNFEKDHPDIFEKLSEEFIKPNFTIKKDLKNKKSEEFKKLEELIESQKLIKDNSFESINRNKDLIKLHSKWLDAHVELQPFELKKKLLENKLKVLVGEYQGIKDICSWKREKNKQIKKNTLLKFDSKLANKYISIGESQIRFKVNDFRPYHFD